MNNAFRSLVLAALLAVAASAGAESLWKDEGSLYTSKRKFEVGDIITIIVEEDAKSEARWKAERDNELEVEGTAAPEGDGAGEKNLLGRFFPFMGLDYEADFTKDVRSSRKTTVVTTIAVEVVNILPNGNLQVVGRKNVRVNSEDQLVEVRGNLRPEDISEDNTVSSTRLANGRVLVNGRLRFTQDEKPGFVEWFFGWLFGVFL